MKIKLNEILFYILILFPITTILQGISVFGGINKLLIAIFIIILFFSLIKTKMKTSHMIVILVSTLSYIISLLLNKYNTVYNFNEYFYYLMWIYYLVFLANNYYKIIEFTKEKIRVISVINIIWSVLVLVSMVIPSCYVTAWGGDKYFMSFASGEHRFASTCLFEFCLIFLSWIITKKKYNLFLIIIPIIGIFMSGARTYLGVILILFLVLYYTKYKKSKIFIPSMIVLICALIWLITMTPMMNKMSHTLEGSEKGNNMSALTSSRSDFWRVDLESFKKEDVINKVFGNGINYVYVINGQNGFGYIWAHNDYINILLSFGYIGLIMYILAYLFFINSLKKDVKKFEKIILTVVCGFNAFFNMLYTYTCSTLAIPFILYALCIVRNLEEKNE